jgi:diguanylate cyclase (GGDEF)-like protein
MERAASDETLSNDDRTALVSTLAAMPGVDMYCLDRTFRPCPVPGAIPTRRVMPTPSALQLGAVRDIITSAESLGLAAAIGHARRRGVGACAMQIPGEDALRTSAIIDMTDLHGVYVSLSGPDLQVPETNTAADSPRPRRVVHHRNEVAELTWVDPRTRDLLGLEPDEMVGRSALDFIHPDDHDRGIDGWIELLSGQPSERHRVRWVTADRGWCWLEISHIDRLDTHGYVETEMVDVDDEMRALALAREGKRRFQTLTESLPLGVVLVNAAGDVEYMNPWLREFAQFDPETGDSIQFPSVHNEDRDALRAAFTAAIETSAETDLDIRVEVRDTREERICRLRVRPVAMDPDDPETFERSAIASIEDITDSLIMESQLRQRAMTDDLTGLHTRAAVVERLQSQLDEPNRDTGVAALFVDLDGFKIINDGLGHDAGDDMLVEVASRLAACLRDGDYIARVGSDEFVVILSECADLQHAGAVADRLIDESGMPVEIDGNPAKVSCSVGIAFLGSLEKQPVDELLTNADLAMYKAKRAGGGQWATYDDDLPDNMTRTFELRRGIVDSLDDNEFSLFLQPLRNLTTGQTVGAECLVRWFHPVHGLTGADQFIPIAEQSGLIVPLGRRIMDSACRIAARASATGRQDLRVSVNISGRQLAHSGFVDEFLDAIDRHGVSPSQMILEVTETVFVGTDGDAVDMLRTIKRAGCTIALDDFGTGYSSLNQLRLMPASMIKIDGSYIGELEEDTGTKAITQAMVDLSRELGLELIAEGVETPEQLRTLQLMEVELGQGYLLGRPVPEEQFFTALRQRQLARFPDFSAEVIGDDDLIL